MEQHARGQPDAPRLGHRYLTQSAYKLFSKQAGGTLCMAPKQTANLTCDGCMSARSQERPAATSNMMISMHSAYCSILCDAHSRSCTFWQLLHEASGQIGACLC